LHTPLSFQCGEVEIPVEQFTSHLVRNGGSFDQLRKLMLRSLPTQTMKEVLCNIEMNEAEASFID
jgi:hypothetical protein